jgi:hypothetical protein
MKTLILISLTFAVVYLIWLNNNTGTVVADKTPAGQAEGVKSMHRLADKAVEQFRHHRSAFAEIIQHFEKDGAQLETTLESGKESLLSFKSAIHAALDRDAEFNKVYASWHAVELKSTLLHNRFKELVNGAEQFYAVIRQRAESINDEGLRTESLAFIDKSEQTYAEHLKNTQAAIALVDGMKVRVDDTMKALEIRFAVEVIDHRLGEIFAEIDTMIESVLSALKALEEESKSVLGQVAA